MPRHRKAQISRNQFPYPLVVKGKEAEALRKPGCRCFVCDATVKLMLCGFETLLSTGPM
jgi:hypothetical protein